MKRWLLTCAFVAGCAADIEVDVETETAELNGGFCYDEYYSYCDGNTMIQVCPSGENSFDCGANGGWCESFGNGATCSYPDSQ